MVGKFNFNSPWIIDSGVTQNIVCIKSTFSSIRNSNEATPVIIPNGDNVPVEGIGTAYLPNSTKIDHVLYIPDLRCILFSISKFTKDFNCFMTFYSNSCLIQYLHSRKLVGMGRCKNGLY